MLNLRNNFLYNKLKENYYHYLAYLPIPHRFVGKKIVSVFYDNKKFKFKLKTERTERFTSPVYLNSNISFFKDELPGYIKKKKLNGGIIVDCGAFEGAFSIYASKMVGKNGKVIAFEPGKDNLPLLKENIRLNNSKNIVIIPKAVWNRSKKVLFEDGGLGGHVAKTGKNLIEAADLDSELKRLKIPYEKVSFIKMDIEGAEIEAIDGMKKLLLKGNPFLSVATYHERDGERTFKKVEEKLKKLGYKIETGYPQHLTTWAWRD